MDIAYIRMLYAYIMKPIEQLFPKTRAEVIRLLFTTPERALHLREIARLSGLAVGSIQRETANLVEAGLVLPQKDGNRLYFRANRDHPIFPDLQAIVLKTTGIAGPIADALMGLNDIRMAFVYGSFATGNPTAESDVDLCIVGDIGLRALAPRLKSVAEILEREINPSILSVESFVNRLSSGDAFLTQLKQSPKLWIIGNDNELASMA